MDVQSELLQTVGQLYASVIDESTWEGALTHLTKFVGGSGAVILTSDPRASKVVQADAYGVDPSVNAAFMEYYASKDIRVPASFERPVGELIVDRSVVSYQELRKSEIYNDFLLPFDVPYLMAMWLRKAPDSYVSLPLQAGNSRGPFTDEEIDRFRLVIPHLMRVMQVRQMLDRARINDLLTRKVLGNLPFGVLVLDARGNVTGSTGFADDVLTEGTALKYQRQRIRAVRDDDDRGLQAAIHSVVNVQSGTAVGSTVTVRRPYNALPLTVAVLPVNLPDLFDASSRPACLLLIVDPDRKVRMQAGVIQRSLDLSPAESRLALAVFHGQSLQQAAKTLGRSYNTCKTQMKAIYLKTGCASQAELVKKIMTVGFAALVDPSRPSVPC